MNATAQKTGEGYLTYTLVQRVLTNSRSDGPKTVLSHADVPTVGDTYAFGSETDTTAFFTGANPSYQGEEESLMVWLVTSTFSNAPSASSDRDPTEPPGDPLDEPPVVEVVTTKGKKAILFDITGDLIASSAGEPYDPVQEVDDTRYILRTTRNQATVDPGFYATYRDTMNAGAFAGFVPYELKVEIPGAFKVLYKSDGTKYYQVVWEFSVNTNPGGWNLRLYDYGMYKVVGGAVVDGKVVGGELVALTDKTGNALTAPRLLDGAGGVLDIGADPVQLPSFLVYDVRDFSALGLTEFDDL